MVPVGLRAPSKFNFITVPAASPPADHVKLALNLTQNRNR
jgi:hypothetical protein